MNESDPDQLREMLGGRRLVIASNRGPIAFEPDATGEPSPRRGAGGLVTALSHIMVKTSGIWVASAMTASDREMARASDGRIEIDEGAGPLHLRYLAFRRDTFDRYYNRISNRVFWFLMHGMWNLALEPRFDRQMRDAWESYKEVNTRFAEVLATEAGGTGPVMTQDYHLMLVPGLLRQMVPKAVTYHFAHTPWPTPDNFAVLPDHVAGEVISSLLAADLLGFQTPRWARNFLRCCQDLAGAEVNAAQGIVEHRGHTTAVRVYPISIDVGATRTVAQSADAAPYTSWLEHVLAGRKLVLRVDRMELTKNVTRGLRAFEEFLRMYPEWMERVIHVALVYPSRRALPEYRSYEAEVLATADRINEELGTDQWQPVLLFNDENYTRAMAALTVYDVLVVNPIADGMNLVAKEGPAVNQRDGVLVLSRNAGAWHDLGDAAVSVNPFDLVEMAEAINTALTMPDDERKARAVRLRETVESRTPADWVAAQLRDLGAPRRG